MIAEMYKRREKLAYGILVAIILIIGGYLIIQTPETGAEWFETSILFMPVVLAISVAIVSRHKYNKVKDFSIPYSNSSILEIDHVVLKKDAGLLPRLLSFEKEGNFLGTYKLVGIPWWAYPLLFYRSSLITLFPVTIAFVSHEGEIRFRFKRSGFKETTLMIYNQTNQYIGKYVQPEFKNLLHIKGELKGKEDELILPVKASGFSGDFTLNDANGHQWAHFFNGRFPHEYTQIFRDTDNDIVEISNDISKENKMLLLAMIGYLFFTKGK